MKFTQTTPNQGIEILANDHYAARPVKIDFSGGGTILKAGTPVTSAGAVATGGDVAGILLWNVTPDNPNGTMVVHGFIETAKAQAYCGVAVTSTMKEALPMVFFL